VNSSVERAVSRQRVERRAKVSRDKLLSLFDKVDGFFIIDKDWQIKYWNSEMTERTGLSTDEALDRSLWDVYEDPGNTEMRDKFTRVAVEGETAEFRTRYADRWLDMSVVPFEDFLFVHSRDVTSEIQHQQQLYQRNERLQQFLSTVRHDLKTPLTIAEGRIQLVKDTGDPGHLEDVEEALGRMSRLIDDLLKIAGGQEELDIEDVSLRDVATEAWEDVGIEGQLEVTEDMVFKADPGPLRRLFVNLFRNVHEHAGSGVSVWVGSTETGFYVEDDGIGIEDMDRDEVFKPGKSGERDGDGLGLSIVQLVADVHGWGVSIIDGKHSGACFEITHVDLGDG
jgi:PAS domain S-box-containing protein